MSTPENPPMSEYSQEKMALALEAAAMAAAMADRLKALLDTQPKTLPIMAGMFGDGIIERHAKSSLYWADLFADYFNATDAVDEDEDAPWDEARSRIRAAFTGKEAP
jgi:hypothetical protein